MDTNPERGSAIIMLFVAVALFGMISYVFLQGSRGNTNMIKSEADKASAYKLQDCSNVVSLATKRLAARGCGTLISIEQDGSNTNIGAPVDGSCSVFHPNGGGVEADCATPESCDLTALAIGERCDGIVYAGESSGNRIYTTENDAGTATWNNGSMVWVLTNADSEDDGLANTDILVNWAFAGGPHAAAIMCRALGAKWYLPASTELILLYNNRVAVGNFATSAYWSSTEGGGVPQRHAIRTTFSSGMTISANKNVASAVRCVRQD